ncbi:aspartyl protease family protein [Ekhidna sp.]|uniref:aspartyl protease family protein n=1 Tax=Ekhidna sp. TaxID=2608089 RepID=UPI003298385C
MALTSSDQLTTVDFEMYHNIIIVEAYVNNKWSKFIVDTGASVSLLDFTQSKKYDFTYSIDTDNRLTGFGGKTRLMRTSEVSFTMKGALTDRPFSFSASDLSGLNTILSQSQQRVLGILGNDFLQSHGAIIDYRRKKLQIASIE